MAASTGVSLPLATQAAPAAQAAPALALERPVPPAASVAPAPVAGALRPRLAIGVVVVLGVMALQLASDAVSGKEHARLLARFVYMGTELPLLMFTLTAVFRRSLRGTLTAAQGLVGGVAIATAFGCVYGWRTGSWRSTCRLSTSRT
jgi:hypothetical protein